MMRLVLEWPNDKVELELIAVCINLACNVKNAKLICDNKGLRHLMKRAFKLKDNYILKMIRNISQHQSLKGRFVVSSLISWVLTRATLFREVAAIFHLGLRGRFG